MSDSYTDRAQRHELYLQRLATELLNKYGYKNLQQAYRAARLILLDSDGINTNAQLNRVLKAIQDAVIEVSQPNWQSITDELYDTAVYESGYYAAMFGVVNDMAFRVPTEKKVRQYMEQAIMSLESGSRVNAGVWSDFVSRNTESIYRQYNAQVTAMYRNQESLNQGVARLRNITNGILRNEAETLVRTGMSHFSINAREVFAQENSNVIKKRFFNATFDNRTTVICMSASSSPKNPWDLNDPSAPVLPLHFGERSNWLFLVEGQTEPDGLKAAVGGKDAKQAEERFERRDNALNKRRENPDIDGPTSSQVRYRGKKDSDTFDAGPVKEHKVGQWLRKQPRWFIEDTLGKERAELFLSGAPLTKFTDASFRPLTLNQIREKD